MMQAAVSARTSSYLKRALLAIVALLGCIAGGVYATNYTLWIHGRNGGGAIGNHLDFSYWGADTVNAGVNKRAINWDGYNRISATNGLIRDALDCYCTGSNWCYIAAHSAGDNQIGYALSLYGGTAREVKNPDASCTGTGTTQTGWNIKFVGVAAGSGGGTELANYGAWAVSDPLTSDLKTSTARAMYDHNQTRSTWFYMYAGAKGQDDEVVAYHSSGGVAGSGGASYCNPADWFCNYLSMRADPNENGSAKWSYHYVSFRDDGQNYDHYTRRNWQGIASRLRAAMELYAR